MKFHTENRSLDKLRASFMYIGIITIVTIVVWVSVSVYALYSKQTIDPKIQAIIEPINPSLDSQVLSNYSSSRIRPPEKFKITSVIEEGNQITQLILDPYVIDSVPQQILQTLSSTESASPASALNP